MSKDSQEIKDPNANRKAPKMWELDPIHIIAPPEIQPIPTQSDESIAQKRVVKPEKTKPPQHPQ